MDKNIRENIDKTLFNEQHLHLLNIRDLRDMGRKVGVPSPTSLKKRELVDYILKIVYGEIEIPVRNSGGRPSIREFDMDRYISKIKSDTSFLNDITKYKLDSDFGLMAVSSSDENYVSGGCIENKIFYTDGTRCVLRKRQFIESPDDIEISKSLAHKLKLENFDVLEVMEFEGMCKIITINGIKVKDKFVGLNIDGKPVEKGNTANFYLRTKEEIKAAIESLENSCTKNNIKLIVFSRNEYMASCSQCVTYSETEEASAIYKKFMIFAGFCEEAVYGSEDIVVVVENIEDVENLVDSFDADISARIKKHLQSLITKIITLGNAFISFKIEEEVTY